MTRDTLRVIRFRPYLKGKGPSFRLKTWDADRVEYCKQVVGYRLSMGVGNENAAGNPAAWAVLFEGEDFGCSPLHAIDSDAAVEGIMSFLTLQPGDTDPEYFAGYTPEQLDYCSRHAESLSCEVDRRFGGR